MPWTLKMGEFLWNYCINFYLVILPSTHIEARIPLNTSLCLLNPLLWKYMLLWAMCVQRDHCRVGLRRRNSWPMLLSSNYPRSNEAQKQMKTWFSSCEIFSKSKQKFSTRFALGKFWCGCERLIWNFLPDWLI